MEAVVQGSIQWAFREFPEGCSRDRQIWSQDNAIIGDSNVGPARQPVPACLIRSSGERLGL
jgi:hypothetical protein